MSINFLSLREFKCHVALDLPLAPLTVLTGLNSSGKSTVCQALALLGQSFRGGGHIPRNELLLNGDLVRLGNVGDVQNQSTDQQIFGITLRDETAEVAWRFTGERRNSKAMLHSGKFRALDGSRETDFCNVSIGERVEEPIAILLQDLEYLTTLRRDPAEVIAAIDSDLQNRIGSLGEGTVPLLYLNDQEQISENLRIDGIPPTLPRQVEAWMQHFFPGFAMEIQPVGSAMEVITLRIRTELSGEFHLPPNVGYGPYYVLPIVTAALSRTPGQLLILDSPEAHLHPSCQNEIAKFLAKVAASGVQVLVETHNDHFINGARIAVRDGRIPAENVIVHYFGDIAMDGDLHQHSTISIDHEGILDHWPKGFFDQYEADLASLTKWKQ
ncbi:MAG: DUF3696 domain-containing protein [Gammaproteobacteria bacterium]|nr:DUF3696 domain-containing protein [Gammaproteobacteria bacterium]